MDSNASISDTSVSPEEQAEQIKSIYPIVDGQTPATHSRNDSVVSITPSEGTNNTKPQEQSQNDLIDFGQNDAGAGKPTTNSVPAKTPDEIEKMLASTGKPADGPLIDFASDVKKELPDEQGQPTQNST